MRLERGETARAVATLVLGVLLAVAACPAVVPTGERSALTSPASVRLVPNEQQVAAWQVSGTCEWCIVDGQFEVRPAEGRVAGTLGDFGWLRYKPLIKSAVFLPGVGASTCEGMFQGCDQMAEADFSGLDGTSATSLAEMFDGCSSIEEIDLTALDVSRAKTLNYLFYNCGMLKRLDLSSFDTSGVIQMEDMFGNDASLKEVRLGHGFSFCGAKQEPLCQLPSSVGTHLLGWRNSSGRVYAASEIPANQAETYRSGIVLDADLICLFSRYYVYDGSPVSLILTTRLAEGVDYTASYIDNVEVGTGSVTFEGINDYLGSLTFDFDISQGVPQVDAPEGIVASWGQRLSEVALPDGWTWDNPDQVATSSTDYIDARATFTPADTRNYVSVAKVVRVQIDCDGSWAWDGRGWWWNRYDGTYPRSCWKRIGGSWYLFDAVGYMLDDWQSAGGSWYWLGGSGDGAMRTGW